MADILIGAMLAIYVTFVIICLILQMKEIISMVHSLITIAFVSIIGIFYITYIGIPIEKSDFPIWIQAAFTIALVIITAHYASSTQVLVKISHEQQMQAEHERKRQIVIDMARNIYSPIRDLSIANTKNWLEDGEIVIKGFNVLKVPPDERINIFNDHPLKYLNQMIHPPDMILLKYLDQIRESSIEYDRYAKEIEKLISKINEKRLVIWPEFKNLCNFLNESGPAFINEIDYERIFAWIVANKKLKLRYQPDKFILENKDVLLSKLYDNSFKEDMEDFNKIKTSFIEMLIKFDKILSDLLSDWIKEYDISNSMIDIHS